MKIKALQTNRVLGATLLIMLLLAVGEAQAQYYNYDPALGVYTEEGSTSEYVVMNKFNYSNCNFLSTTVNYYKGHVNTCLYSHNTSSGLMRFRVAKCDNNYYFGSGGAGKIIIVENNTTVVLCESYSISGSSTHYIEKSLYHDNFTDVCWFDVYLITSDLVNYYYAGRVTLRRAYAPIVNTDSYASDITTNSATIAGTVNPQGLSTNYYFQYGTSSSFGSTAGNGSLSASYTTYGVGTQITGLQSGTTYYYRLRAYNDAGTTNGTTYSFTTEDDTSAPEVTTNNATNITAYSGTLKGTVNPKGLYTIAWFEYGTTTSLGTTTTTISLDNSYTDFPIQHVLNNLQPNTRYYYRAFASNSKGQTQGSRKYFYTDAGGDPIVTTGNANSIESTSATITGTINPQGLITNYFFTYGTTTNYELGQTVQGTLSASTSNQTVSANLTGLVPNTTYHYRLYATNNHGSQYGDDQNFTTQENLCYFTDCTSGDVHDAALFLCERGVVTGDAGTHTLRPNDNITRGELSKAAFFGLYSDSNGVSVPSPLVTDYFPCIYPDLQESSYYFQAAKALLYLEYGDGISPFDRNRSSFNPSGTIQRCFVIKVLLETFNIAPVSSGSNGFYDFGPTGYANSSVWGYAQKAKNLGIVQTQYFRPDDACTRGEAFLFLYRILQLIDNNSITKPTPNYDTYNPLNSDFFVPSDLSPEVANAIRGVEYGNFNYYNKDFFNIPGYMNLDFGIAYNSYLTEMPDDFYPVKPLGKAWTHTYDMYLNIIPDNYNNTSYYVFHMQEGALLIYSIENGNLKSLTEGNYYTLSPMTPQTTSTTTYTLTSVEQISYTFTRKSDGIYYLTQIKDRNNNAITINYGSGGNHQRINSVTTLGRTLTFGYTSDTLLNYVKDPINRYVYFYYTDGQMTSLKDAKNQTTHFNYGTLDSEKGLLKEIQLPKGNYVYNDYQRRKLKSMSYFGISTQTHTDIAITPDYQNHITTSAVTETLSNNQSVTTTYTMNDKNRVTYMTDNNNTDISYQYGEGYLDNPDLLTKKTDNKTGLQTSYGYDTSNGMVSSVTYSNGSETHTIYVNYNSFNDITNYTDANNNTTHYGYDPITHNLTSVTDPLGKTTYIDYDNTGHGVPIRVTNPMGVSIEYGYNNYGNLNEISVPSLNLTATMLYDGVSRTTGKTDFGGHTTHYTYDNNDNLETITDANGNTTTYNYDANDNVIWIQNSRGYKTNMTYDFNTDFMTQVEFQGHTRSYTYKKDGSLESFTNPNGNTFNYTYNNSGELISDGYASLGYNSNTGMLESVTKDGKSITFSHDSFERINSITYDGKTVSYTYDNNGNVKTIVYPGNKTVTYTYDALNRITMVKDWNNKTTTYDYRDDGQLNYFQYPNGVRTTYNYDTYGRCNGISTKRSSGSGSVIAEYSFELDNMSNHTSESFTEPFVDYPSIPSANITYNYNNANRLISAGDLSFGYDDNGNTTSRTGRTYGYDTKDNLTSVSGDFSASYTYDGLGNRRSATRNGVTTKYVLNLLANMPTVLMETNASGAVQNYYIYGPSGLISRIDANNNTNYYVYDFRGSTVAMTDATTSANITHKYQYDDFGKLLQMEEEDENAFRYVGKYGVMFEDEALTFMRARYYDPEIGRFLSEDPIWSTNLYPYVGNNPIMGVDPNGDVLITATTLAVLGLVAFGTYLYGNYLEYGHILPTIEELEAMDERGQADFSFALIGAIPGPFSVVSLIYSIGTSVVDIFDPANRKYYTIDYWKNSKPNKNDQATTTQIQGKACHAAPEFQHDIEALKWMWNSGDDWAKKLKGAWLSVRTSDRSIEEKHRVQSQLYKSARQHM